MALHSQTHNEQKGNAAGGKFASRENSYVVVLLTTFWTTTTTTVYRIWLIHLAKSRTTETIKR